MTLLKTLTITVPLITNSKSSYTKLPPLKLPSELCNTSSKLYPPLKPLRKPSTSLSNLLDNTSEHTPSQDTTSSFFVPHHRYNLRDLPSRRLSTDTSTLNLSALSSNSTLRLVRQHAQPLSSETNSSEFIPSPYFTSGFETASLLSSDAQSAFFSGNLFSEVIKPTLVPAHFRLPEYYTSDHSRPQLLILQTTQFELRKLLYTLQKTILVFQFLRNTLLQISNKRKETELKIPQTSNLVVQFEVKVKVQGLNPHPVFHVAKMDYKTTPAILEFVHIDLERDPQLLTLTYGKIVFYNPYYGLKYTASFKLFTFIYTTNILLHSFILTFTSTIPITIPNRENYLPSDDPNFMVSHYDCEKLHNLRPFNLINVKQCIEAPSNIQHASVKARVYVRAKTKPIKAHKCVAYDKKERKICFQGSVKN